MTSVQAVFAHIDRRDRAAVAQLFAEDATMTFGNQAAMHGREAIAAGSVAFWTSIAGLSHRVINDWVVGQDTIVEAAVTYTRRDGNHVTIPAVSIWRTAPDGLITDYRVFVDLAPVFTP
jgi:ketosteroid isomerase-like protein